MTAIPKPPNQTVEAIYRSYETDEPPRGYLGASIVGKECCRALWYDFRHATHKTFDGRMMRLFQTGHREEARLIDDLRRIGVKVWANNPSTGKQWAFSEASLGHHLAGHADGILQGLPEAPKAPHLFEAKTHSQKSFDDLKSKGVRLSKPQHFAQMQVYMRWSIAEFGATNGCNRALYLAQNKNTDELYQERVEYDKDFAEGLIKKAASVIFSATPPQRISDNPSWYACKFCDHHSVCHGESLPIVSCRTCAHATPEREGHARWSCARYGEDIPLDAQREGCAKHRFIPVLLERVAEPVDSDGDSVTYRRKSDGFEFKNADDTYSSREIRGGLALLGDEVLEEIREVMGGRIQG